jgi:hypothetical protein
MRRLALGAFLLSLCACGRLAQYGDPRLRPQAETPPDATTQAGEFREVTGKGTVRRVEEDGGFWGVRADDGRSYRLATLPPVFQKEGTRVRFRGRLRGPEDPAPWRMVLELIDLAGV